MQIELKVCEYSVAKYKDTSKIDLKKKDQFISVTEEEVSVVAKSYDIKPGYVEIEEDFKLFKVVGQLDFSLTGVISKITTFLAKKNISVFVISTFNTDYFLVKRNDAEKATSILRRKGYDLLIESDRYSLPNNVGLCLSGGGARGAYQIGAVTALNDLGLYENIKSFTGTSIGSANITVLASQSIEYAKNVWFTLPEKPLVPGEPILEKLKTDASRVITSGMYSMDVFEDIIVKSLNKKKYSDKNVIVTVSESGAKEKGVIELVRSSFKHYVGNESKAVYVDLNQLNDEAVVQAVKASCSIPVVFPPVVNEEKQYFDGGMFDNTPIKPLVELGYDEVILVNISNLGTVKAIKREYPNLVIHEIKSDKSLGNVLDFTQKHIRSIYNLGYKDTIEYFNKLTA